MLIIQRPWTKQPQYVVRIDTANPITQGLVSVVLPSIGSKPLDLLSNSTETTSAFTPSIGITERGKTGRVTNTTSQEIWTVPASSLIPKGATTLFSIFKVTDYVGTTRQVVKYKVGSGVEYIRLLSSATGVVTGCFFHANMGAERTSSATGAGAYGWQACSMVWNGTLGYVFVDTVVGANSTSYAGGFVGTDATTVIGDNQTSTGLVSDVLISLVFNRALTQAEHLQLRSNPWQLFAPRRIFIPVSVASGPATHTSTGALTADPAVIAGTAGHVGLHPSTGALTAGAAVTAGTAGHVGVHPATGVLTADPAVIAGTAGHTAANTHPATGALTADQAVVAGTAGHVGVHTATGALTADSATVSGIAGNGTARKNKGGYARQEEMRRLMIQSEDDILAMISTIMASGVLEEVD